MSERQLDKDRYLRSFPPPQVQPEKPVLPTSNQIILGYDGVAFTKDKLQTLNIRKFDLDGTPNAFSGLFLGIAGFGKSVNAGVTGLVEFVLPVPDAFLEYLVLAGDLGV